MSNNVCISVIVPFYNAESYLDKCINSVLNQTFLKTFEVIFVDDASIDKGKEIFKKYIIKAKSIKNITFCGRTGLFRYLDMVPAVELHLKMAKDFLKKII